MRHFSKTNNGSYARTLDIYYQIHPLVVCDGADYVHSSTEKTIVQRFEIKTEDMKTTPHEAMGVGSPTTIHRASSRCLPQVV